MKILLTGANGQLGRSLSLLKPKDVNLISPSRNELDLTDNKRCFEIVKNLRPDWIINAAAYTNVDKAEEEKEIAFKINAEAPKSFAQAIEIYGGKLMQISTDFVFGGYQNIPYLISQKTDPINTYGETKACGEIYIKNVLNKKNNFLILRTSWLMSDLGPNFALKIINLLRNKKELEVVNDQIGAPTTTYSLADIIWKIIFFSPKNRDKNAIPNVLHWSDSGIATWYDVAVLIEETSRKLRLIEKTNYIRPIQSSMFKSKAERPAYSVLDSSETHSLLDVPYVHWKESGMHVYTWKATESRPNFMSLDIYTCKDFDINLVIEFTKSHFQNNITHLTWRE